MSQPLAALFHLYESRGDAAYVGEPVSVLEHSVQSAQFAEAEGYDEEVILAAFLHDIGHLLPPGEGEDMAGLGHRSHEKVGAAYLRQAGFSEKIAALVLGHVQAKRYLCRRFPAYHEKLSEASRQTLVFQGGVMTEAEARAYETEPYFDLSIRMRHWDEAAKVPGEPRPALARYRDMAGRLLNRR